MWAKFGDWLDERFQWRQVWEAIFLRKIPHVNWLYTLGSATLFVATMQGITGILLTIYYVPDPTTVLSTSRINCLWVGLSVASITGGRVLWLY